MIRSSSLYKVCAVCCCRFTPGQGHGVLDSGKTKRNRGTGKNSDKADFNQFYKIIMNETWKAGDCTSAVNKNSGSSSNRLSTPSDEKKFSGGNLAICKDCQTDVSSAVARNLRLTRVEKKVKQLQQELLEELLKLGKELRSFFTEMEKIETIVECSDELDLESSTRWEEQEQLDVTSDLNNTASFRRNILKYVHEMRVFKCDFSSKFYTQQKSASASVERLTRSSTQGGGHPSQTMKEDQVENKEVRTSLSTTTTLPVEEDCLCIINDNDTSLEEAYLPGIGCGSNECDLESISSLMQCHQVDGSDDDLDASYVPENEKGSSDSDSSTKEDVPASKPAPKRKYYKRDRNRQPAPKNLKCNKNCGKIFYDQYKMLKHSFACDGIYYKPSIRQHPRLCGVCGKSWIGGRYSVLAHRWSHMGEEDKAEAKARGEKDPAEQNHLLYHSGKRQCAECGFITSPNYLIRHIQLVHCTTEEKARMKVQCHLCPSVLSSRISFRAHMRGVHGSGQTGLGFQCHICQKKWTTEGKLLLHMKYHSEERPFECEKGCGLKVKTRHSLRNHYKFCRGKPNNHNKVRKARLETVSAPGEVLMKKATKNRWKI